MKDTNKKLKLQYGIAIAAVMLLTFLLNYFQPLYTWDKQLEDLMVQRPAVTDSRIRIIKIDEKTLAELGQYNTWDRNIPAELVELLNADPDMAPAVLTFDILYMNDLTADGDVRFAKACKDAKNVITANNLVYEKTTKQDANGDYYVDELHIRMVEKPYEALNAVTRTGFANTTQDKDGYIRQALAYEDAEEGRIYSLAYETYAAYMEDTGRKPVMPALYANNKFDFTYTGKSGSYEAVSLCDVLNGTVDARTFKDCIVFVGAYAPGMQDAFHVAVQRDTQMYGVEIHANIVEALMNGKTAVPANRLFISGLLALVAGLFCVLMLQIKVRISGICVLLLTAGELVAGALLYQAGYVIPLIGLPLVITGNYVGYVLFRFLMEQRKRQEVLGVLKKYVAPQVVEKVSKSGEFHVELGGERRQIAVMFVDIRGFTSMSEKMEPEQVVEILNTYLSLTTNAIFKNGGTLDKFIGDATMAVFNAPLDLDDYIYRAVCTAVDIVNGAKKMEQQLMEKYGREISFGIGIHCGPAVVGNIGCDFRMDYTAIGDTVNTASRLESRAGAGEILVSEQVYEAIKDRICVGEKRQLSVKGKEKIINVYCVEKLSI